MMDDSESTRANLTREESTQSNMMVDLGKALAKAQAEFPTIACNRTGQIGSRTYRYADLYTIHVNVRPVLEAHNLVYWQTINAQRATLVTWLLHWPSGGMVMSECPIEAKGGGMQDLGSAITYARRYGLSALVGLVIPGEDDDAAIAQDGAKPKLRKAAPLPDPEQKPTRRRRRAAIPTAAPEEPEWMEEGPPTPEEEPLFDEDNPEDEENPFD